MLRFYVVAEAAADYTIASTLADRVSVEKEVWLDGILDAIREWRGIEEGSPFTKWTQIKALGKRYKKGLRTHGKGTGYLHQEAIKARALSVMLGGDSGPDCLLLVRDTDNSTHRREDFVVLGEKMDGQPVTLVAVPHTKRECWVLNGYVPADTDEEERIDGLRTELGFNPVTRAEELTAATPGSKRNAKRVLGVLTNDQNRQAKCWEEVSLGILRANGEETGLASYLDAVEARLVPLFTRETG